MSSPKVEGETEWDSLRKQRCSVFRGPRACDQARERRASMSALNMKDVPLTLRPVSSISKLNPFFFIFLIEKILC